MPTMQIKRGTAAALAAVNPTPLVGELVWDSTNNTLRVGNGSAAYSSLAIVSATPSSHTHGNITNAGAIGSSANLPIITTTSGVLTTGSFGSSAATFCEGNDSRLSDTRTPTDGSVTTAKIANDAVTYAKIQNVSATDRLLGRSSAGAGDVEEITCTAFGRSLIDDADAAAARTTLSVQPTASPAFTGTVSAAAANFTGAVSVTSPLAITGTVAGNVRQIKMQTSGVDRWQITPSFDAESGSNAGSNFHITRWSDAGSFMGTPLYITRSTGVVNCESGLTIVSGQLLVTAGSVSAPGVAFSGDTNTGLAQIGGADTASVVTAGVERVRVGSNGRAQFFANSEKFGVQLNNGSTGNGPFIGSDGADIFTISTSGGAERVRIDASGNVGVGVSPSFRLDVLGSANCVAKIKTSAAGSFGCLQIHNSNTNGETSIGFRDDSDSDASSWVIGKSVGGVADAFGFYYNGNRAIIESDGVVKLPDVYEDTVGATNRDLFIDSVGKLGYVSSIRASKTNIAAIDDVSWLRDLTPVSFHYRRRNEDGTYSDEADGTLDYGLIAEEVEPVAPEMCFYDFVDGEPQLRGVHYSKLITPMLRYIQQLEARIAALEERVNA